MLVVESLFTWDIESFVDLCFDVVSFVTALTKNFRKFKKNLTSDHQS